MGLYFDVTSLNLYKSALSDNNNKNNWIKLFTNKTLKMRMSLLYALLFYTFSLSTAGAPKMTGKPC